MDREGSRFAFFQEKSSKHGETQGWYIWWPSNKRTHEEPNVWWSTEQSCTVHLAVTEVSRYKLPGKAPECRIQEGIWRAIEEFLLTQDTNVSQTAISAVTLGLFSKELWRFEWIAGWALSPRHLHYGRVLPKPVGCEFSCRLLLVLEMGCCGYQTLEEVPKKIFHP